VPKTNPTLLPFHREQLKVQEAVFEMKGTQENLPHELRSLLKAGLRKNSFSKYLGCYKVLTNAQFEIEG
jgi:hypothetical protein